MQKACAKLLLLLIICNYESSCLERREISTLEIVSGGLNPRPKALKFLMNSPFTKSTILGPKL